MSFTGGTDLWLIMWIENVGSRPQTYSTGLQRLTDDRGRVFAPEYGLKPGDQPTWDRFSDVDLNPGVTAQVRIDFVVPKSVTADHYQAELHGSPGSPGAIVQLGEHSLPNCI